MMNSANAEFVPLTMLADRGAFGCASTHAQRTASRRWAAKLGPALAEKRGAVWFVCPSARLPDGRTVESLLRVGAKVPTLNGFRLPPGAENWGQRDRKLFLDTHELKRRLDALAAAFPRLTFGGLCAIFADRHGTWARSVGLSTAPATVRRYLRRIDPADRLFDGNVDRRGRARGSGEGPFKPILEWIAGEWLKTNQRKIAPIWREAKLIAKRDGLPCPSLRTAQVWIDKKVPKPAKVMAREGPRAWYSKCRPKSRRDYESIAAGDHWCGDERTFDFFARVPDARAGWRVIRPKLTAFTDFRSRRFVGWHIGERANSDTILAAYMMGAREGVPLQLTIDNGRDYRAVGGKRWKKWADFDVARLGTAFEQVGIQVHFAIPHHPSSKPIESLFNPVAEGFDKTIDTYCGPDPQRRPYDLNKRLRDVQSVPTLDEIRAGFAEWLDVHHRTPQSGDGMYNLSPNLVWERFRGVIRRPPEGVLDFLCAKMVGPVKVSANGVRYRGITYGRYSRELYQAQGKSVYLRVMPDSAASVIVCDERGVPICIAENAMLRTATQDDVRANMQRVNRLRKATQEYLRGRRHLLDSTPAQIMAMKREASRAAERKLRAELPPVEGAPSVRIVRSDLVEPVKRVTRRHAQQLAAPPPAEEAIDFDDLYAGLSEEDLGAPQPPPLDFADMYDEDDAPAEREHSRPPFWWVERVKKEAAAG